MANETTSLSTSGEYKKSYYKSNLSHVDFSDSAVKLLISEPDYDNSYAREARPQASAGMTFQELQQYAQDPFWVRIRTVCFFSLWFGFVSLLVAVLVLTVQAPRCRGLQWWQQAPVYQLLAPSYQDTDQSGRGDLRGIESKLDYIVSLGVKTVWLSPIYQSPMKDFGYDIENFTAVDATFGNMEDFKRLVRAMKHRDLKLVMDFVPNHSSDQHVWFKKSLAQEQPFSDYYIWAPPKKVVGGKPLPPNNWVSVFGGSAWEWNQKRQQFYLHQFAKEQPDLNFRNQAVVNEMLDVLRFWLDLGVDGFRVDAVAHLFEDPTLADEPLSNKSGSNPGEYSYLDHVHTHNLPETLAVIAQFRQVLAAHAHNTDNVQRLLMVEVYESVKETMKYYGEAERPLADFPFNFLFISNLNQNSTATEVKSTVDSWISNMPRNKWANWVTGSHDSKRVSTRLGPDMVDAMNMILLLLPGTAVTYYGEEIGMEDTPVSWQDTVDPAGLGGGEENYTKFTRDPARTPMQWDAEKNAGFSSADKPWLPVNPNHKTLNVELQQKQEPSHLSVYKALVRLRSEPSLMYGKLQTKVLHESVFAFTRVLGGSLGYAVAVNWGSVPRVVDLSAFDIMAPQAQVYLASVHSKEGHSKYVDTRQVSLEPKEGIVLMFTPNPIVADEADIGL